MNSWVPSDSVRVENFNFELSKCNICVKSQPAGYNNYEKPYFCTKTELQIHFRGKHTKEYLQMVSALTGKPAGKKVQLGRHNHLKADLNITARGPTSKGRLGPDAKALVTDPLPTNHYSYHNRPGDLSTCNYRPGWKLFNPLTFFMTTNGYYFQPSILGNNFSRR